MKSVAFFTNKGGVGKTTLVCNLAAFLAQEYEYNVLIVDTDPQSNATHYMFSDKDIAEIYDEQNFETLYDFLRPVELGKELPNAVPVRRSKAFGVDVVLGDPRLALLEDLLAADWNGDSVRGLKTTYIFRRLLERCGAYDYVFFDMGPSLGSINRAALLANDFFVIPLSIDIFSVRAVENISSWMKNWQKRLAAKLSFVDDPDDLEVNDLEVKLQLAGYVSQQYTAKRDASGRRRAVRAFDKIKKSIPSAVAAGNFNSARKSPKDLDYEIGEVHNLHSLTRASIPCSLQ